MNVRELLKKFNVKSTGLSEQLLSIEFDYVYSKCEKEKMIMDTVGYYKQEFEVYKFTGEDCECLLCPQNEFRTLSFYYKENSFSHGYGYDEDGGVIFIV